MVDPLGSKTVLASDPRIAPVTRATAAVASAKVADRGADATPAASTPPPSTLSAAAQRSAAKPPVDTDRVAEIRAAIANGTFPIYPARIADRLIALKLEWNSNDPA